jgi:hypothetical protein
MFGLETSGEFAILLVASGGDITPHKNFSTASWALERMDSIFRRLNEERKGCKGERIRQQFGIKGGFRSRNGLLLDGYFDDIKWNS